MRSMCHRRIISELELGSFPTADVTDTSYKRPVFSAAATSMAGSHTAQRRKSGDQQGTSTTPHQASVTPRTRAAPLLNASPTQLPGETSFHKRLLQLKKTWNSSKPLPAVFMSQNHLLDFPTCLKTEHCYKCTDKTPF